MGGNLLQSTAHLLEPSAQPRGTAPRSGLPDGEATHDVPPHASLVPQGGMPLVELWSRLREGHLALIDHFVSRDFCYAVFKERDASEAYKHQLSISQADLFARLVAGQLQKVLALELRISPAAVTLRAQRCVHRLGLQGKPSSLPLFIVHAGQAPSQASAQLRTAMVERYEYGAGNVSLYSLRRTDLVLPTALSRAEREIARMIVEGRIPTAIAEHRQTTWRTAANQRTSIFTKLGVSGRLELIAMLASDTARRECATSVRP